jgi:hypothetical protein
MDSMAVSADTILDILERALHSNRSEWLFFRELRVGTGFRNGAAQRLDAFALNCLPHLAMRRICYEIKVSRADFLAELSNPLKRRIGMRYSNEFYFVTPKGLLEISEIPVACGLIEIGEAAPGLISLQASKQEGLFWFDAQSAAYCTVTVPACWRETPAPTWQFAAAMLRNQQKWLEARPAIQPKQQRIDWSRED